MTAADASSPSGRPEDRRQYVRVAARVPVKYRITPSTEPHSSITVDVGGGGICLLVSEVMERGTEIDAELTLPAGRVRFTALVAWCEAEPARGNPRRRAGLAIVSIAEADHLLLTRYCLKPGARAG